MSHLNQDNQELVTADVLATLVEVGRQNIYYYMANGVIAPARKEGRSNLFDREKSVAAIQAFRSGSTAKASPFSNPGKGPNQTFRPASPEPLYSGQGAQHWSLGCMPGKVYPPATADNRPGFERTNWGGELREDGELANHTPKQKVYLETPSETPKVAAKNPDLEISTAAPIEISEAPYNIRDVMIGNFPPEEPKAPSGRQRREHNPHERFPLPPYEAPPTAAQALGDSNQRFLSFLAGKARAARDDKQPELETAFLWAFVEFAEKGSQ